MAVTNEVCVLFLHPLPENSALQKACKKLKHVSKQPHTTDRVTSVEQMSLAEFSGE